MYSNKVGYDKFYTKLDISKECVKLIDVGKYNRIVEPSAGSGSFLQWLPKETIALDICPEHESVLQKDWFEFNEDLTNCLVIGNPPFGKRNKLSKEFIKHCINLNVQTIAFVLPNVYHKHTLQSVFTKEYRLVKYFELPKNSFTVNGEDFNLPCTFFIWDRSEGKDLRCNVNEYATNDFEFVTKSKVDDDCFFIMGASPNVVKELDDVGENNRGYYIKPNGKSKEYLMNKFKKIAFTGLSSVNGGASWRTKFEIIKNYVESMNGE